jgi:hypothetical protein
MRRRIVEQRRRGTVVLGSAPDGSLDDDQCPRKIGKDFVAALSDQGVWLI